METPVTITHENLFTAACLWEAALDFTNQENPAPDSFAHNLRLYRARNGTCALREAVTALAPACDAAWNALSDDERDNAAAFDWEWCPAWLAQNFPLY